MPIRKVGSEMPIRDIAWKIFASTESRRSAEYTPIRMPNTSARMVAQVASSSVAGRRSFNSFATGCRNW